VVAKLQKSEIEQALAELSAVAKIRKIDLPDVPTINRGFMQFQRTYRHNPLAFVHDCIEWNANEGPTHYQEHALAELPNRHRIAMYGPRGLGKCLAFGEDIRTVDGQWYKVEDLIDQLFIVPSVNANFEIVSSGAMAKYDGLKPVVEIVTEKGRKIVRTVNHPLWVDNSPQRWDQERSTIGLNPSGQWTQAGEIKTGATIAVYSGPIMRSCPQSEDDLKLAAYLIANGSLTGNHVGFSIMEGPVLEEFKLICSRLDCKVTVNRTKSKAMACRVRSKTDNHSGPRGGNNPILNKVREWEMNVGSYDKKFPDWVWSSSPQQLAVFLSRLYACDGWVSLRPRNVVPVKTNREIGYCSVSKQLVLDVHRALLSLGINSTLARKKATYKIENGTKKHTYAFSVTIHDSVGMVRFCDTINIIGKEEKLNTLRQHCVRNNGRMTQTWRTRNLPSNFMWEKVKSVTFLGEKHTVCVSVPQTQTFLTEFLEHNSTLMAWLIWWALLTVDDVKVPITAGDWGQLEKYLWPEIHKWSHRLKWDKIHRDPPTNRELMGTDIVLTKTCLTRTASPQDEAKFEGAHAEQRVMACFDEAKVVRPAMFDNIEGSFSLTEEPLALAFSTPDAPIGRFYDICVNRENRYSDWYTIHVTDEDQIKAGRMSADYVEKRRKQWGENSALFRNHIKGEFAADAVNAVIPWHYIEGAMTRWSEMAAAGLLYSMPTTSIACDPGAGGSDPTIVARKGTGNVIKSLQSHDYKDTMQTAEMLKRETGYDKRMPIYLDVIGIGTGIYDYLSMDGYNVIPFVASAAAEGTDSSGEVKFLNQRAYAWFQSRELLDPTKETNVAIPNDDDLKGELAAPIWEATDRGKRKVQSKDELRKNLGRSTDHADAVIMALVGGVVCRPYETQVETFDAEWTPIQI
jgi:intein/homing endonuclease